MMNKLIGQHMGPYRVLEQIGSGGMATVYKAYQPAMDRYVAIKVIASHFVQDEMFLERFRREAQAVAKLEHAHILPVYDSGEAEDRPYLVMRYLEAGTLKDRMAEEPLPLSEVNRVVGQVGSALDYAHRMGVIHRDVKPANVLLDAEGDAFLTDFGLAKMVESSAKLTGTGVGIGTPAYMSPEQGKGAKVDSRADVYSLGVMLYEMVTGRAPYEAETPLAVVLKHITEPLPLPRSVRPDLPEDVERVILRALAKEPDDRFQTAGEMVRELDAAVRAAEAAARTEPGAVARAEPSVAGVAAGPAGGALARAVAGVREGLPAGWGRAAMWVAGGALFLLALFLILSRVPLRVQVSGGQLEVVRVVEGTPVLSEPVLSEVEGATPIEATVAGAMATLTSRPTVTPTPRATSIPAGTPGPTEAPPAIVSPAVAALEWERVYDGAIFRRATVSALAVDPQDPNVVYAATSAAGIGNGAGIYKSSDGGTTWTPARDGLERTAVSGIYIDPLDSQTVYATTFGAGPYKSTDCGAHWKPINTGLTQLTGAWGGVSPFLFDPTDHSHLYHSDPWAGVYHSTDGGESWQFTNQPDPFFISLAVDPRDGNHLFAGAYYFGEGFAPGGLYESTDGGLYWTPIGLDITGVEDASVGLVAIDPRDPDSLYVSLFYSVTPRPNVLIASSDGGKSWKEVSFTSFAGELAVIGFDPAGSHNVYIGAGNVLYRSDDDGRTWQTVRGDFESNIASLAFAGDRGTLYVGTQGVQWTSDGGQSWQSAASDFGNTWLELIPDPAGGTLYAEDSACNLYQSGDGGATWETLKSNACGLAFDRQAGWLYRQAEGVLVRSDDRGQTWSSAGPGAPRDGDNRYLYISPQDANTLYSLNSAGGNPFIHRSTDGGQTWQPIHTVSHVPHGRIVMADDGLRMYVVGAGAMDISDDGGESWRACPAELGFPGSPPAIVLHPQDSDTLLLGQWGAGIIKSTDACESWTPVSAGLDNLFVNTLVFDPHNPSVVYAGTDGGAFVSLDGGDSWSAINSGLGSYPVVYSIAVDPVVPSQVYAATLDGIFRLVGTPSEAATTAAPCPAATSAIPILAHWPFEGDLKYASGNGFDLHCHSGQAQTTAHTRTGFTLPRIRTSPRSANSNSARRLPSAS